MSSPPNPMMWILSTNKHRKSFVRLSHKNIPSLRVRSRQERPIFLFVGLLLIAIIVAIDGLIIFIVQQDIHQATAKIEQVVQDRTSELVIKNRQLGEEKEKAQKYLDVAGVMLVALDASGKITLINKQGCALLQISENQAIGLNWFDHFLPEQSVECLMVYVKRGKISSLI